jgi:hypothetical protein
MTSDEMLFDPAIAIPRSYKGKKNMFWQTLSRYSTISALN